MSAVRTYTEKELLDRLESLPSFHGFKKGLIIDLWVRSNEDIFDRFDDKVYTFDCTTGTPRFVSVNSGTTNAGAVGLKHFAKWNSKGCAILKADEYVENSHAFGLHKGQYPAYRQVKPFPYYRDSDRDNKAEELGRIYNDIIYANSHRAGLNSQIIGGWSVACLVRNNRAQYNEWLRFMNRRPLSTGILKEF